MVSVVVVVAGFAAALEPGPGGVAFGGIPPALIPVVAAVVASVIGALLWRLFKLALQLVMIAVLLIVGAGVVVSQKPELIGLARDAIRTETSTPKIPNQQPGAPRGP